MELDNGPKSESRIPRKPERPYVSSFRSYSMEARRRPLRTYSKRTSSDPVEPASKRRCISSSDNDVRKDSEESQAPSKVEADAEPSLLGIPSLPTVVKKGTITAYFQKRVPQLRAVTPPPEPSSELTEPTATPPSSPPISLTRKRVRRLRTRITTGRLADQEPGDAEPEDRQDELRPRKLPTHQQQILSEITSSDLNPPAKESGAKREQERQVPVGNRKVGRRKPSVQTTLSLSMADTAYTECKECDMLYNHLDKTDVRYHARHHTAKLKAQTRADVTDEVYE